MFIFQNKTRKIGLTMKSFIFFPLHFTAYLINYKFFCCVIKNIKKFRAALCLSKIWRKKENNAEIIDFFLFWRSSVAFLPFSFFLRRKYSKIYLASVEKKINLNLKQIYKTKFKAINSKNFNIPYNSYVSLHFIIIYCMHKLILFFKYVLCAILIQNEN